MAVADIGGGGTEIVLASGSIVEVVCPTTLGAVRLTEMFADSDGQIGGNFAKMVAWIDRELKQHTKHALLRPHLLIGSGGTFTAVAEMVMSSKGQSNLPLRRFEVTRAEVSHLVDRLRKLPTKARRNFPGLHDRADIIVAGVTIIDRLMNHFQVNRVQIHDRSMHDGLLLTMLDKTLGRRSDDPHDRDAAVDRFATSCGVDLERARHAASSSENRSSPASSDASASRSTIDRYSPPRPCCKTSAT